MINALDLIVEVAARCQGQRLPSTYIVLDLETNGLVPGDTPPLQYGVVIVKDNKIIERMSFVVKIPAGMVLNTQAMKVHGIDQARIDREGHDPAYMVPILSQLLHKAQDSGASFLGHNISGFDKKHIEIETARYGAPFKFTPHSIIDTGALVKAAQIPELRPLPDEDLDTFFRRVHHHKQFGIYWKLYPYCYDLFQLARFSCDTGAHDAGVDCEMTHWVYQTLKDTRFGGPYALADGIKYV